MEEEREKIKKIKKEKKNEREEYVFFFWVDVRDSFVLRLREKAVNQVFPIIRIEVANVLLLASSM